MDYKKNKEALEIIKQMIQGRIKENASKQTLPQFFGMLEEDLRLLDFVNSLYKKPITTYL